MEFETKLKKLPTVSAKLKEMVIKFKPERRLAEDASVMIMGNFNGYTPILMQKYTEEEIKE